jgi:Ca-activated chloride channel family protein
MEQTRIVSPGGIPSQGAPAQWDPARTAMGGPGGTVGLEVITGNRFALATANTREQILCQVSASGMLAGRRLPLNLALVIDRSGSMEGEPLEYVKRACAHVVDLLEPSDILSVVTFEDRAEVVMPARRVVNKALIKEHISRIEPGNTTNLYEGMMGGAAQVASVPSDAYVNRILVLTDGEPTAGIKDYPSIVGCAAEQKSRGIALTVLGFGPDYNEELLAGIARRSGGNYYYISRPELIPEVFRKELDALLTITAKNLRLRLLMSRWVQVRQFYGYQPAFGNRTAEIMLPDLERGAAISALVELELGRRPAGSYRVARAELAYDDCVGGQMNSRVEQDVLLEFVTDPTLVASGVNPVVQRELEIAQASRNLERTIMGLKTQQISPGAAAVELQRTQMLLSQQGRTQQAHEIGQALQGLRQGSTDVEKTLIGAVVDLDLGKHRTIKVD